MFSVVQFNFVTIFTPWCSVANPQTRLHGTAHSHIDFVHFLLFLLMIISKTLLTLLTVFFVQKKKCVSLCRPDSALSAKLHKFAKSIVVQNEIRWDAEVNWSSKKNKLNSRSSESNSPRFYCFCAQLFISFSTLVLFHYRNLHARIAIQEIYTVTIKINGHVEPNFLILAKSLHCRSPN